MPDSVHLPLYFNSSLETRHLATLSLGGPDKFKGDILRDRN